jgi:hypothetical protein
MKPWPVFPPADSISVQVMLVAIKLPKQLSIMAGEPGTPGGYTCFRVLAAVGIHHTAIQLALHDPPHPTKVSPFGIYEAGYRLAIQLDS